MGLSQLKESSFSVKLGEVCGEGLGICNFTQVKKKPLQPLEQREFVIKDH